MPSLPGNIHGKLHGLEFWPSKYSSSAEKIKQVSDFEFTVRNVVDCACKYNLAEKVFVLCDYRVLFYLLLDLVFALKIDNNIQTGLEISSS